ncbi:cytochrome P450 [Massarina eburnea CBS 473.64]|uniref:Cytochrome P450 n=1 Tax=Massarina eburnea CBS 473.64 TaxID=1395130 RepID=A0A6A6S947_9PLEO|nr:cytochrome P450 [Massarina eburnea CBS 473.64]
MWLAELLSRPKTWMVLGFVFFTLLLRRLSKIGQRPQGFPPGPPTLPLIGNLHQMPKSLGHLQFEKWAREYGPIFSLILGTKVVVVLSSDFAVKDLLDKRSAIYSSRPEVYLGQEIVSGGLRPLFMEYGEAWRKVRRLAHGVLNVKVARSYVPYQDLENKIMLKGLVDSPHDFINHIRRYTTSLTTQMTFGYRTPTSDDPELVEMFHPCCCIDVLRAQKEEGFSDDLACYMSGSLLQAGSETTAAILIGFFLAMVRFPDVARQAQAEIDRVCGDRLPDLNDFHDLTYVRGCMKESLRWMPAATLGVPHAVTKDDSYMGYNIPKGATVLFNVWGISNDPKRHPDPRNYDPSRWANDSQNSAQAALNADPTKRDHFVFGAGRRMCQGMHIADRSLFLAMSRTLWAFEFKRAIDEKTGQEIIPDEDNVVDGLFMCPKPFPANIVPRSAAKVARVEEEVGEVMKLLDEYLQWKTVPDGLKWKDYEAMSDDEDYLNDVK